MPINAVPLKYCTHLIAPLGDEAVACSVIVAGAAKVAGVAGAVIVTVGGGRLLVANAVGVNASQLAAPSHAHAVTNRSERRSAE